MIRRKIIFEYRITCYDDRDVELDNCPGSATNWPTPNIEDAPWYEVPVIEEKDYFDMTLDEWAEMMTRNFDLLIQDQGDKDCQDITEYLHLCEYEIRVISIEETIIAPPVPKEIIEAIKGYERSAKSLRETAEKIKAIPELAEDFLKRAKELEEKAIELRKKYGLEGKEL